MDKLLQIQEERSATVYDYTMSILLTRITKLKKYGGNNMGWNNELAILWTRMVVPTFALK